jgi:hypothetical protein
VLRGTLAWAAALFAGRAASAVQTPAIPPGDATAATNGQAAPATDEFDRHDSRVSVVTHYAYGPCTAETVRTDAYYDFVTHTVFDEQGRVVQTVTKPLTTTRLR